MVALERRGIDRDMRPNTSMVAPPSSQLKNDIKIKLKINLLAYEHLIPQTDHQLLRYPLTGELHPASVSGHQWR
ncbi:hypothetical protein L1987_55218 [Smallanthus sonchifolius]|uniref:Uncharacterized protein n=1 Tax=Smallanthus sonchifolius TaxID=185202 RepID=A0ACB9E9R1_9ASTR|nr:hypothetical protein L1987_55218 [Smallanthus sonchifolius]